MNRESIRDVRVNYLSSMLRIGAGLLLVCVAILSAIFADAEKAYHGGHLVLGKSGVLILRIILSLAALLISIILLTLINSLVTGWVLRFRKECLEINAPVITQKIDYEDVCNIEFTDNNGNKINIGNASIMKNPVGVIVEYSDRGEIKKKRINLSCVNRSYAALCLIFSDFIDQTKIK